MTVKFRPHADRNRFASRIAHLSRKWERRCSVELYRFIDPRFSKAEDIMSGAGAKIASGRWHLKGAKPISYTAMEPETALAEALAHVRYYRLPLSTAMPRVLVSLKLNAGRVIDLRRGNLRRLLRLSLLTMTGGDWRRDNLRGREAVTQAWGEALQLAGYEAVIVPSAAARRGSNILVYRENLDSGSTFDVINEVRWPV
jgi:RES domain-containing protein